MHVMTSCARAMQVPVLKAVCAAFIDGQEPVFCNHMGSMDCISDGPGATECASNENNAQHRSHCIDTFMGYECACDQGYIMSVNAGGVKRCVDVNECAVGDPCGTSTGQRSACHNVDGSFWWDPFYCVCCVVNSFGLLWRLVVYFIYHSLMCVFLQRVERFT